MNIKYLYLRKEDMGLWLKVNKSYNFVYFLFVIG